jgi:hypothetical protein
VKCKPARQGAFSLIILPMIAFTVFLSVGR